MDIFLIRLILINLKSLYLGIGSRYQPNAWEVLTKPEAACCICQSTGFKTNWN